MRLRKNEYNNRYPNDIYFEDILYLQGVFICDSTYYRLKFCKGYFKNNIKTSKWYNGFGRFNTYHL